MQDYLQIYNAIPVIFDSNLNNNTLYHYTGIEGFLLMMEDIKDKKCNIFPGHLRYQNDMQELSEGESFVEKKLNLYYSEESFDEIKSRFKELNDNIYIVCFSSNGDLLEQWKYYGENCGLSIEFDFKQCQGFLCEKEKISESSKHIVKYYNKVKEGEYEENKLTFDDSDNHITMRSGSLTRNGASLCPLEVLYLDKDKEKVIKRILSENLKKNMEKLFLNHSPTDTKHYVDCAIASFIPMCKNINFKHERESRLLFFPLKDTKILYRKKNNRILPYFKCVVVNKCADKSPICSVTVGPGNNQNLIFNSVINIIEGIEYSHFFTDEEIKSVLESEPKYTGLDDLKLNIKEKELGYYINSEGEKVLTYYSVDGIYIYRSPIPFRD